ncbi:F-box/kelch-repeat protein-like protein [Tanacetum coccineum]
MIIKGCLAVIFGGGHCSIWVMREYNDVASWTKAFDILEGILMNEDHKDSISYNHEAQTRLRLFVDSSYKVDMDMCVESLELIDKEIVGDDSYFLESGHKRRRRAITIAISVGGQTTRLEKKKDQASRRQTHKRRTPKQRKRGAANKQRETKAAILVVEKKEHRTCSLEFKPAFFREDANMDAILKKKRCQIEEERLESVTTPTRVKTMEREDELQIDGSLELVNMDDHDTENKKQKREAVASSCLDSDGSYEYLCSEVSETPVITEKPLDHNDAMSYHLCEDLIDEIFIRLPFKSLVRNTSLSKSWRSRISTPSFIRKHTLRSATTQLHPQKYFLRKHVQYVLLSMGRSTVCDLLHKGYTSLKSDNRLGYCFEIVGSYNGIICLFNKGVHSITLWNPSIRRKLTVPAYPSSYKRVSFGFGFDPISNDYKIVAMSYSYYEDTQSFIYSVKTNSWSKIVSPATNVYGVACESHDACLLNGTLHWVVRCELNDIKQCSIITFDLSTNVFGFISLPYPSLRFYNLRIIKGCLAVMCMSRDGGNHCSIWVMREYNNVASWTKAFHIFEGIHMNEDHKDSTWYNHETQTRSRLIVDSCYTFDMDMCVESLELIDKEIVGDDSYFLERCLLSRCIDLD